LATGPLVKEKNLDGASLRSRGIPHFKKPEKLYQGKSRPLEKTGGFQGRDLRKINEQYRGKKASEKSDGA